MKWRICKKYIAKDTWLGIKGSILIRVRKKWKQRFRGTYGRISK